MRSKHLRGYLFVAAASLLFGFNVIFARVIGLPSPILLFYRYVFAAGILIIYLLVKRKKLVFPKTRKKEIIILGFLNTITAVLAFYAFVYTSIANAEILLYASPIYVVLLAPIFLKEKIEKRTIVSLVMSFIGIILIAFSSGTTSLNQNNLGILLALVAGITFALFFISSKITRSLYDGLDLNLYMIIISICFLFPFIFLIPYQLDVTKLILLLLMGLIGSALALSLYFQGVKLVKAQHTGIISYFEPLSAIVYAMIIFGEIPSLLTILGSALILYSGYTIIRSQK